MDNNPNNDKKKKKQSFDRTKFKKGIAFVESNNGKFLWNKTSSATGKYQFLYNEIKHLPEMKGITREQFRDNPELQESIMDLAIDNKLKNRPGYYKNADDLTDEFKESFGDKWNYRSDEVAVLSHFLGRQGARNYLKSELTGKNFKVPGQNLKVSEYLNKYNNAIKTERGIDKKAFQNVPDSRMQQLLNNEHSNNIGMQDTTSPDQFNLPEINPLYTRQSQGSQRYQEASQDIPVTPRKQMQQSQQSQQPSQAQWIEQYLSNNEFAMGGNLGIGGEQELTEFNSGGTHEQNPLGGIPQGIGPNGKQNTVEEGETSFELKNGKFIFSNRLGFYKENKLIDQSVNKFENGGLIHPTDPPKKKTNDVVHTGKEFVHDWFSDPITKAKMQGNMTEMHQDLNGQSGPIEDYGAKIDSGLRRLDDLKYNIALDKSPVKGSYKNGQINFHKKPTSETSAHEHSHALGVDDDLTKYIKKKWGTPTENIMDKWGTDDLRQGIRDNIGQLNVSNNVKHMRYLGNDSELHPRIMSMRKFLNVKPGQEINDNHIKALMNDKTQKELFKYYDRKKIKDILNTVAFNENYNSDTKLT